MLRTKRPFLPDSLGLEARVVPSQLVSRTLAPVLHLRETTPIKAPDRRVVMMDHLTRANAVAATELTGDSVAYERPRSRSLKTRRTRHTRKSNRPSQASHRAP